MPLPPEEKGAGGRARLMALLLALAAVTITLSLLEWKLPYYFLCDDNRSYTLPLFAFEWNSLFRHGSLGLFNFHQFLGNPNDAASAVLFPPVYASAALSELFSGGAFLTLDILAWGHLLAAAAGMFLLLEAAGAALPAAAFAAAAWGLSPFAVMISSSWWITLPAAVYLPWGHYFLLKARQGNLRTGITGLTTAKLFLLLSGYTQYLIYISICEILFCLMLCWRDFEELKRTASTFVSSCALALLLSAPMFMPTIAHMPQTADRAGIMDYKAFTTNPLPLKAWLYGQTNPFSDSGTVMDDLRPLYKKHFALNLSHSIAHLGYITLAGLALCLLYRRELAGGRISMSLGLSALVCLLWAANAFAPLEYKLPLLNRFRWHFKIGLLTSFYLTALGALGLAALYKRLVNRPLAAAALWLALPLCAANALAVLLARPDRSFSPSPDSIPLSEPHREQLAEGRIFSLGYVSGTDFDPYSLGFNYASLWQLSHFSGYDAIVLKTNKDAVFGLNFLAAYNGIIYPNAVGYFRKWNVRWYVVKKSEDARYCPQLSAFGIMPVFIGENRVIYEDRLAGPLVALNGSGLPYSIKGPALEIETDGKGGALEVAVLHNPYLSFEADGRKMLPEMNKDRQLSLQLPPGTRKLRLRYSNPWFTAGAWIAAFTGLLAAILLFLPRTRK